VVKGRTGHRITLQLDPRIALEAIILNRMERIPKTRRQEWLRGLLVQGFRAECRALRDVPRELELSKATAFSSWLENDSPRPVAPSDRPQVMEAEITNASGSDKPFARLSKVIG